MTNFEYLKSLDSEYEMADMIMYFFGQNLSKIVNKEDQTLTGLPFLKWLQEERKTTNQ